MKTIPSLLGQTVNITDSSNNNKAVIILTNPNNLNNARELERINIDSLSSRLELVISEDRAPTENDITYAINSTSNSYNNTSSDHVLKVGTKWIDTSSYNATTNIGSNIYVLTAMSSNNSANAQATWEEQAKIDSPIFINAALTGNITIINSVSTNVTTELSVMGNTTLSGNSNQNLVVEQNAVFQGKVNMAAEVRFSTDKFIINNSAVVINNPVNISNNVNIINSALDISSDIPNNTALQITGNTANNTSAIYVTEGDSIFEGNIDAHNVNTVGNVVCNDVLIANNITLNGQSIINTVIDYMGPNYLAGVDVKTAMNRSPGYTVPSNGFIFIKYHIGMNYYGENKCYINGTYIGVFTFKSRDCRYGESHLWSTLLVSKDDVIYYDRIDRIDEAIYYPRKGAA